MLKGQGGLLISLILLQLLPQAAKPLIRILVEATNLVELFLQAMVAGQVVVADIIIVTSQDTPGVAVERVAIVAQVATGDPMLRNIVFKFLLAQAEQVVVDGGYKARLSMITARGVA